jgi:hypothetical protein
MKTPRGKIVLNLLLIIAVVFLMLTQFQLLQKNKTLKSQVEKVLQSNAPASMPDNDKLLQLIPDSLYNNNSKLIVLRDLYSECKDCRDSIFEGAIRLASKIGKENLCIVAGNYQEKDFLMYKRLYSYSISKFINFPGKIAQPDTSGLSYYFMINKRLPGQAEFVFFPQNSNKRGIERYFDKLAFLLN